jgi:hypothetical protein
MVAVPLKGQSGAGQMSRAAVWANNLASSIDWQLTCIPHNREPALKEAERSQCRAAYGEAAVEISSGSKIEVIEMPETIGNRDPLYLFLCDLEWRRTRNLAAHRELLAALNATDADIRVLAEALLQRNSPRPEPSRRSAKAS